MPEVADCKTTLIYQCVELDPACVMPVQELTDRPFLLAVAQHRSNKNLDLLLASFHELQIRGDLESTAQLVIVGSDGPETSRLRLLIRDLSLQEHVLFKSGLADQELCWLYKSCALFIAPSSIEGFGLPVIEALRCGSRVLCADIPAFREVGGAACAYFDLQAKQPVMTLADAICAALLQPETQSTSLERFSTTVIGAQYAAMYSALIAGDLYPAHSGNSKVDPEAVQYDSLAS